MTLYYENISTFNFFKNLVQHSQSRHIIHMVEEKVIELKHSPITHHLVDIFTKGLDAFQFKTLGLSLGCASSMSSLQQLKRKNPGYLSMQIM